MRAFLAAITCLATLLPMGCGTSDTDAGRQVPQEAPRDRTSVPSAGGATQASVECGSGQIEDLPGEPDNGNTSSAAKGRTASDAEELAIAVSQSLNRISQKDIIKEFDDKLAAAPTVYTSSEDGFSVTFPKQPTATQVAAKEAHTRNYQTYSADGLVSYNVFFNLFEKKILAPDSQAAFFKTHLAGRLLTVSKAKVVRDDPTTYNGFAARDFAYIDTSTDPAILHRGLLFLLDGDAVSLTTVHPTGITPQYSFEDFVGSFRLLPLSANLNNEYWQDQYSSVRLRVPADMRFIKGRNPSTGLIATFANTSGHSLSIFHASSAYPGITVAEVEKELGSTQKDKEGWYTNRFESPSSGTAMLQLMRLFDTPTGLYMFQGVAPEKTFFRCEAKVKESARTLVLVAIHEARQKNIFEAVILE